MKLHLFCLPGKDDIRTCPTLCLPQPACLPYVF
jgi:hypothetical protein